MDVDEKMDKEFTMDPERALQTAPVVYLGESSRVAATSNFNALQRLLAERQMDGFVARKQGTLCQRARECR